MFKIKQAPLSNHTLNVPIRRPCITNSIDPIALNTRIFNSPLNKNPMKIRQVAEIPIASTQVICYSLSA